MSFTYLASPYSVLTPGISNALAARIRKQRFERVCTYAAKLMEAGENVFCPIAHSHPIEVLGMDEIHSGDFWLQQDFAILQHASKLTVLMMDGWEHSKGIAREIEFAEVHNIPVEYVTDQKRKILPRATEEKLAA